MLAIGTALLAAGGLFLRWVTRFPPDTMPEGAYMRIAAAIGRGAPEECFAYLEEEAQHAAHSIVRYAKRADASIRTSYPTGERERAARPYALAAGARDGAELFARLARARGWIDLLRRDLSGIERVELSGAEAVVVTVRGTRYPFRRRPGGIWGLSIFTGELRAEAERLARDWEVVQRAAEDYRRAGE
ncbi:MAG: hypothetical protein HY744_26695 [Deltaproteobacteria bacterium]|nr:hypothetical protein [Deltaproteobacteria bacterium]